MPYNYGDGYDCPLRFNFVAVWLYFRNLSPSGAWTETMVKFKNLAPWKGNCFNIKFNFPINIIPVRRPFSSTTLTLSSSNIMPPGNELDS